MSEKKKDRITLTGLESINEINQQIIECIHKTKVFHYIKM